MTRISILTVPAFVLAAMVLTPGRASAQSVGFCVNNASGEAKVAASAAACKNNQVFVSIPAGPAGPQGAPGPAGPQGPAGISGLEVIRADYQTQGYWGGPEYVTATCPVGKKVLSGTWYVGYYQSVGIHGSVISADQTSYIVEVSGGGSWVSAFATCATVN